MDITNTAVSEMVTEEALKELLSKSDMKSCEFHLKAHYDGLILFAPNYIFILSIEAMKIVIQLMQLFNSL